MHEVKAVVDLFQFELKGNHRADLDLAVHVPVDEFQHIGAAFGSAKSRAFPDATGDQLERAGADFLPAGATPMIIYAPAIRRPWITFRPTPPRPKAASRASCG